MTCLISLFSAIKSSCTGLVRCSRPDSKAVFLSCLVPYRTCSDLWHPNGQIPYEDYKRRSPPPSLIWPLRWIKNPLNLSFLRSNSLSLKLQSNPSLLGWIWAKPWVTHSIFEQEHFTNNLHVFITLSDSSPWWTRCPLRATKVVVSLKKFVLPSPLWEFDSGNRTWSWWSFDEVCGRERPGPLWAPQRKCRQPLWLPEL
jgi:hypothetical protein